jgi:hypothetical protein
MRYFRLALNPRYDVAPTLRGWFGKYDARFIDEHASHKLPDRELLLVEPYADTVFPDVLSFPFFLTTERVLDAIRMYAPNTVAKQVILLDGVYGKSEIYFMPILESLDCFHADTERNGDGKTFKRLVLARGKLRGKAIFRPKGASHTIAIVRLDLAESILRRDARGIGLEPIEVKEQPQGETERASVPGESAGARVPQRKR